MNQITIDNILYDLTPVQVEPIPTTTVVVDHKKPRYELYYSASEDEPYYILDINDITDNHLYTIGNYFETEQEAQRYGEYQLALGRVNHRIYEMNEGWKADYEDRSQMKHMAIYVLMSGWDIHNYTENHMSIFTPVKSYDILSQLFTEMKDDFDTVRKWMMQ